MRNGFVAEGGKVVFSQILSEGCAQQIAKLSAFLVGLFQRFVSLLFGYAYGHIITIADGRFVITAAAQVLAVVHARYLARIVAVFQNAARGASHPSADGRTLLAALDDTGVIAVDDTHCGVSVIVATQYSGCVFGTACHSGVVSAVHNLDERTGVAAAGSNQTGTSLVALYTARFNNQVLNDTSSANGAEESLLGLRCVVNENVADGVGTAIKMTHVRRVIGADGCVGNVVQIKVAGEDGIGGVLSIVDLCGKSL